MVVCHRCDRRECVNPKHLFLGTQRDNVMDMIHKGRRHSSAGERNPAAKLRAEQVLAIRHDSRPRRAILAEFGIGATTLYSIRNRERWRHLP
jgi:DNA invertase Pin-like site-specific DNA recombinase